MFVCVFLPIKGQLWCHVFQHFQPLTSIIIFYINRQNQQDLKKSEKSKGAKTVWKREREKTLSCFIFSAMLVSPDVWLSFLTRKSPDHQKDKTNLAIYGCLVDASFVFAILRAYGFLLVSLRCSDHDKMVVAIKQAPVLFLDSNPVGRILNHFS